MFKETRRSKIVSRATGRYAATNFDQLLACPRSPFVGVTYIFFCPLRLFPVFDRSALFDRPRFLSFPKKTVMKKVITHNLKTLSVYSAIQSMFCHLFSLFTFDFNQVLSFPVSAFYYSELLGLLVRDFFSTFFFWRFFLFRPTDRRTGPKSGNAFDSKQKKKVNGLRGSTSKQHTINLVPRAFSAMAWEGKRLWDQGWTHALWYMFWVSTLKSIERLLYYK